MKRLFQSIILLALLVTVALAGEWKYRVVYWNAGDANTGLVLDTVTDTSDVIPLTFLIKKKSQYPETISILTWATEGDNTDSTNAIFTLDLSNDQTYWLSFSAIDTIIVSDGTTTVEEQIFTAMPLFKYARIRAANVSGAGDTLTMGAQITLDYSNY